MSKRFGSAAVNSPVCLTSCSTSEVTQAKSHSNVDIATDDLPQTATASSTRAATFTKKGTNAINPTAILASIASQSWQGTSKKYTKSK